MKKAALATLLLIACLLTGCASLTGLGQKAKGPHNPFKDFSASEIHRIDVCRPTRPDYDDPDITSFFCVSPVAEPITDRKTISTIHAALAPVRPYWVPDPGPGPMCYTEGPIDFLVFRDKGGRVLAAIATYTHTVRIVLPDHDKEGKTYPDFWKAKDVTELPEFRGPKDTLFKALYDDLEKNQPDWIEIADQKGLFSEKEDYLELRDKILRWLNDPNGIYCQRCGNRLGEVTDDGWPPDTLPSCPCRRDIPPPVKPESTDPDIDIGL